MSERALRVVADHAPPPDRGPLLTAEQVAELIGGISPAWVRRNVPHKIPLAYNTIRWYESDVKAWIDSKRSEEGP